MILGAVGLVVADALGRTVIAPAYIWAGPRRPIGAPYFVYLLALLVRLTRPDRTLCRRSASAAHRF